MRAKAPRTEHWVRRADDLSGVNGVWQSSLEPGTAVLALLAMVGDTYLPFLAENASAQAGGLTEFSVDLADGAYRQQPFGYQSKCLAELRSVHAVLSPVDRERAGTVLRQTGCLEFLQDSD